MNLKIMLVAMIIIMTLPFVNALLIDDISYSVGIRFDKEDAFPETAKLVEGTASEGDKTETYNYSLQLTSFKGEKLNSKEFNLPNYFFDIGVTLNNGTFVMFLPYHTNAKKIEIYRDRKKISELDISEFASCNQDGFCSVNENLKECPEDCSEGREVPLEETQEKLKEESKPEIPAAPKEKISSSTFIIIGVVLLVVLILFYLTNKNRKKP